MKLYCLCILLWLSIGMIEADAGILAREKYEDYQEKFDKQIAALHEKVESVERRQADPKSQADVEAAVKQIVISEMDKHRSARFALQASNETRAAFELDDLEVFINKLDSRLKSVEGLRSDVSSLQSQVSNLAHKKSYCQMGLSAKIKGTEWGGKKKTKTTITFGQAFPSVPKVIVAIQGLNKKAGSMNINWGAECCESVKTTSFVMPQNVPYNVLWVRYSWIACA